MSWRLRFLGTGNTASVADYGTAMAAIEHHGRPWLALDCGSEGLSRYIGHYGEPPEAVFITHAHLDHVSGLERLFGSSYFHPARRGKTRIYCPTGVLPWLQRRVAEYPNVLAEGGANFWDAFQLIVVGGHFWHLGQRLEVFPVRHHWPDTAFGLRLPERLVWTGDTRPIPEVLASVAAAGELVAHDCALHGNPSHSGLDDILREYPHALRRRLVLYHYGDAADVGALQAAGMRVALPGDAFDLPPPAGLVAGEECG